MAYEQTVLQRANARLLRRREIRERKRYDLEQEVYRKDPRIRELDKAIRANMLGLYDLAFFGKPVSPDGAEIAAIRAKNESLQQERAALLKNLGLAADALDDKPVCPHCLDSGWQGQEMCECLKKLCAEEQMKGLTALLNLTDEQAFDKLRLDVYSDQLWNGRKMSPRENMSFVVKACESFAREFPNFIFKNLLLSGGTGLGKTFLSGCVAREVSRRGFSVVYDTALNVFAAFETRKFTRDMGEERQAKDDTHRYLNCDLLILDDLGSELTTPMVQTALYELINSRMQADRRTIISTNLSMDHIADRYTPQIASRIGGLYRELTFYG